MRTTDLWEPTLHPISDLQVTPSGKVNLYCQHCGRRLTKPESDTVQRWRVVDCASCGRGMSADVNLRIDVREDHANLLSETPQTWYHVTTRETWHETPNDLFVHVGTPKTVAWYAHNSFLTELEAGYDRHFWCVELSDDARNAVEPYIAVDDNDWPKWTRDVEGLGSLRYLNRFELPGSISLLTTFSSFAKVEPADPALFAYDEDKEF